jgi:syntaxin 16
MALISTFPPRRAQDFRQCQSLIQRIGYLAEPPANSPGQAPSRHEALAAKNVQRGLAAKVQEVSATFRKKQRVYMESAWLAARSGRRCLRLRRPPSSELQGHAIKNQDLMIASGAISLHGAEGLSAVDDDVAAAVRGNSPSAVAPIDTVCSPAARSRCSSRRRPTFADATQN